MTIICPFSKLTDIAGVMKKNVYRDDIFSIPVVINTTGECKYIVGNKLEGKKSIVTVCRDIQNCHYSTVNYSGKMCGSFIWSHDTLITFYSFMQTNVIEVVGKDGKIARF